MKPIPSTEIKDTLNTNGHHLAIPSLVLKAQVNLFSSLALFCYPFIQFAPLFPFSPEWSPSTSTPISLRFIAIPLKLSKFDDNLECFPIFLCICESNRGFMHLDLDFLWINDKIYISMDILMVFYFIFSCWSLNVILIIMRFTSLIRMICQSVWHHQTISFAVNFCWWRDRHFLIHWL